MLGTSGNQPDSAYGSDNESNDAISVDNTADTITILTTEYVELHKTVEHLAHISQTNREFIKRISAEEQNNQKLVQEATDLRHQFNALKAKLDIEALRAREEVRLEFQSKIELLKQQFEHAVKDEINKRWSSLQFLQGASFSKLDANVPAILGLCCECDVRKAELQHMKDLYARLSNILTGTGPCPHCKITQYKYDQAINEGTLMKIRFEQDIKDLNAKGLELEIEYNKAKSENQGLLEMLVKSNAEVSALSKERSVISTTTSCANCFVLESRGESLRNDFVKLQKEATELFNRKEAEIQLLRREATRLMHGYQELQAQADRVVDDLQWQLEQAQNNRNNNSHSHNHNPNLWQSALDEGNNGTNRERKPRGNNNGRGGRNFRGRGRW